MPMPKQRRAPRQGDVLLVPVAEVRGERIHPTRRKHILVHGELTGHHHWVPAGDNVAVFLDRNGQFVQADDSEMKHQEHDPSPISGSYEIVQQRRVVNHISMRASD